MPAILPASQHVSAELSEMYAQKDADEERWLALEMEREALEQDG